MYDFLENKSVLVTGGTGSFGRKFVETLLRESRARRIIIFSRDELKQSQMMSEINDQEERLRFFIGDVRDVDRLLLAFQGVDYVVHAAALKQVPILEYNPFEAIKTNILGTQNVITAAIERGVKRVVLISTDKAANPANLYGATKLCAEKLIINGNAYAGDLDIRLAVVRYGNVFGSRGSLVKIVEQQRVTGRVTLTHEEMTRFWITLDQGIKLVLLAMEKMQGGEIFVPKVPSMKVKDLILSLAPGCEVEIIGIRSGEKLHELLITPEEARHTMEFNNYYIVVSESRSWNGEIHGEGKKVGEGFYFSSLNNNSWLDESDLKKMIDSI